MLSDHRRTFLGSLCCVALALFATGTAATDDNPASPIPSFFVHDKNVTGLPGGAPLVPPPPSAAGAGADRPTHGSRSKVVRPRIAILDPGVKFRDNKELYILDTMYAVESTFPRLLAASPHFTADPEIADYFYVHSWNYFSANRSFSEGALQRARATRTRMSRLPRLSRLSLLQYRNLTEQMEWLQSLPYWKRKGGRDHIIPLMMDKGRCDSEEAATLFNTAIVMQHWGKVTRAEQTNPCMIFERNSEKCDMLFQPPRQHAFHLTSFKPFSPPQMIKYQDSAVDERRFPLTHCYIPGQDLLVPTTGSETPKSNRFLMPPGTYATQLTTRMLFVGGINQTHITNPLRPEMDAGYSFGSRQSAWRMFRGLPGYTIVQNMPHYWDAVHKALFCLAPLGWGWGTRFKSAVARGCIPVIVQDGVKVEWEDELPMFQFAVRIPLLMLHRLPEFIDRYIRDGRIPAFHRAMSCVWRLYWWRRPEGRAFEMVMCELKSRLLQSKVYLDVETCMMTCGDGVAFDLRTIGMNGV